MKRKTTTLIIKQLKRARTYTLTESDNGGVIVQSGKSVRTYQSLTEAVAEILSEYIQA